MLSKNVAASVATLLFVVALQRPTSRASNEIESGEEAYRHIMRDSVLEDQRAQEGL